MRENKIILFENQEVKLEVNMKDETVWLSLEQMAELFSRDRTVIVRHINNIFKDNELDKNEVCAKFAHTTKHGAISDKSQTRELIYYNLDMIISVGYRVKSKNGIIFRKWATKVLKDYMIKGYAVNQKRLEYLEKTIKLIDIAGRMDAELKGSEAWEIIKVINNYSSALSLLDDYDHKRITKPTGTKNDKQVTYEDCMNIIGKLKFNSDSNLFALERNEGLKDIKKAVQYKKYCTAFLLTISSLEKVLLWHF